jgi:hypothetical protein
VDFADGHRVHEVMLLATLAARDDEVCLFEHRQVLHHAEARHLRDGFAELREGLPAVGVEAIEQRPTVPVRKGSEHEVVVHNRHDM